MFHVKHDLAPCALLLATLALWGCPGEDPDPTTDAGVEDASADASADASDGSGADAPADADTDTDTGAGVDATVDAGRDAAAGGLTEVCDGACSVQDVEATFSGTTEAFELGFYGLNAPDAEGKRTLYVELHGDAQPACPTQDSPTPARTLVLSGLPWPLEARAYTLAGDGLSGALLDFEGSLIDGVAPARATAIEVAPRAARVCVECVGGDAPSDPDGFVALDVSLTFEGGTLSGAAYVTHCDSYDEP